jgi:hypothetical protein
MTASVGAFQLINPDPTTKQVASAPAKAPGLLWGQGTPVGAIEPWSSAQKGTLYFAVDNSDDDSHIYQKVDEGGDDADWVLMLAANASDITGASLSTNARRQTFRSKTFNIDNGSGTVDEEPSFFAVDDITIIAARRVYTEATDTAGAASALTRVGTATNGQQIVASVACTAAKAVGSADTLTIASGVVAAGGAVFVRHTGIASTEVGQYYVEFDYTVDV